MIVIESTDEMLEYSNELKHQGKIIASVDTDAELHKGHMSLVKIAKENGDVINLMAGHSVAYNIMTRKKYDEYVTEYRKKPDGLSRDIEVAKSNGVDVFFYPSMHKLYVDDLMIPIEMCKKAYACLKDSGMFGKKHIELQTWILSTYFPVFKLILPDIHVVGQKDAHQVFAVKSLIKQLGLPIKIIAAPISRDEDGLANNSRNKFLPLGERKRATCIYNTLQEINEWASYPPVSEIKNYFASVINNARGDTTLFEIRDTKTWKLVDTIDKEVTIIVFVNFGSCTLSDTIVIKP